MTTPALASSDALFCDLVRVALLALTSGTHHLPDGLATSPDADTARRALADVHDAILADRDPFALGDTLRASLEPLAERGFDVLRLYMLATVARVEGRPPIAKPVDLGGNVTRLPLSAPATSLGRKIWTEAAHDAARGRRRLYRFACVALDGVLAHLPGKRDLPGERSRGKGGKSVSAWQHAADMAHHLEVFVGSAEIVDGRLVCPRATMDEIRDEEDLANRWHAFEKVLARGGVGTWEFDQLLRREYTLTDLAGNRISIRKTRWTRRPPAASRAPRRVPPSKG